MAVDYAKLKGKIVEKCGSQQEFAKKLGLSEHSLSLKLNNRVCWKQSEIIRACDILGILIENVHEYFFEAFVQ